jgi:hypothetical protein
MHNRFSFRFISVRLYIAGRIEGGVLDRDPSTLSGLDSVYTIVNGGGYGGFYCFALIS